MVEYIPGRPSPGEPDQLAIWTAIMVVKPCPDFLRDVRCVFTNAQRAYQLGFLLIQVGLVQPVSEELSDSSLQNPLPGFCLRSLKLFQVSFEDGSILWSD